MEIRNKSTHQECLCYEKGEKPTVEIRKLKPGYEEETTFRKNEIVFMLEGKVRFLFRDYSEKEHRAGEFIFIPVGGVFRFEVLKETLVIVIRLNENVKFCKRYRIEDLYMQKGRIDESPRMKIHALEIIPPLRSFLMGLHETVSGGLTCRNYFDLKAKELLVLLKAYYPKEALREFFSLILSPDTVFSEYVRANHHKYKTAKEIAESMHITPKLFSKKFISIFGEPALNWMTREKALSIYSELYSGNEPITLIVDKYRFSSQSHLNKFCKREFGKNPGEIRRRTRVQEKVTKV